MRALTHAAMAAVAVMAVGFNTLPAPSMAAQSRGTTRPAAQAKLINLSTLNDLKAAFNIDQGKIRIILLLSPT